MRTKYTQFDHSIAIQAMKEKFEEKKRLFFEVLLCLLCGLWGVWEIKNDIAGYTYIFFVHWLKLINGQGPNFPASRGLSRRGKMKREERDLCRVPTSCLMKSRTKFLVETSKLRLMCNARAQLDCTLTIIEPTVDYGFHEICEFRNFSVIKWSVSTLGDKRINK